MRGRLNVAGRGDVNNDEDIVKSYIISTGGNELLMRLLSFSILALAVLFYMLRKVASIILFPIYLFIVKKRNSKKNEIIKKHKIDALKISTIDF